MKERLSRAVRKLATPKNVKVLAAALFSIALTVFLFLSHYLRALDYKWLDSLIIAYSGMKKLPPVSVRLVEIDEATYRHMGYPLSRDSYAEYIKRINDFDARVQAIDVTLITSSDTAGDSRIRDEALKGGNVIFIVNKKATTESVIEPLRNEGEPQRLTVTSPEICYEENVIRFVNAYVPGSGVIEKKSSGMPGTLMEKSRIYPALSVKAVSLFEGDPVEFYYGDPPGSRRPWYLPPGNSMKIGERVIYLEGSRLFVNYHQSSSLIGEAKSFEEVLSGKAGASDFRGRAVILGNSSYIYHDRHRTPLGERTGIEIHGILFENLLHGDIFHQINPFIVVVLVIFSGLASAFVFSRMSHIASLCFSLVAIGVALGASLALYLFARLFLPVVPVALVILLLYPLIFIFRTRDAEAGMNVSLHLIEKMNVMHRTGKETSQWLDAMLGLTCESVHAVKGWVQILDESLYFRISAAYNCPDTANPEKLDGGACRKAQLSGNVLFINDISLETGLSSFEQGLGVYSLLCLPLRGSEKVFGVLALGKTFLHDFTGEQVRQVAGTATLISAFLENVELNMRLHRAFVNAITSLAQAVDARDPYTHEHSTRVAEYSREIAFRLNLPPEEINRIEMAAMLHDIGKIGVPEAVLNKPGKLTDEEFGRMKKHPVIAIQILEPLEELYSLLPLISSHHEKLSGKGYPSGLRGGEIPVGARIIAVADVFDALTSKRVYRNESTPADALNVIESHFAGDLDFSIVEVLKGYLREKKKLS
ncbi:MAG: CHASE2 domain-containing protein [Candidatus Eremiobacteraeota bacterium]|nr:CHASE2 domain-containing protein [Candidatus Eremiobacteraeota bacterium]